jgi:hypothetical protein
MRVFTIFILAIFCMCVTGPSSAHAEKAVSVTATPRVNLPVVAMPEPAAVAPSLVAPKDLLDFVEEQYAYDLIVEVNTAATKYRVPVELCWEVIRMESHFHHINPSTGRILSHGIRSRRDGKVYYVVGICQIMDDNTDIKRPFRQGPLGLSDRATNINCMAAMLQFALFERGYSLEKALGWYNSGSPIINSYARTIARAYRAWVIKEGGTPL